jgi:hypothetical protein
VAPAVPVVPRIWDFRRKLWSDRLTRREPQGKIEAISRVDLEGDSPILFRITKMPILVECACGKSMRVPDHSAGKLGRCPECRQPVRVPGAADSPAPAPAAPKKAPAAVSAKTPAPTRSAPKPKPKVAAVEEASFDVVEPEEKSIAKKPKPKSLHGQINAAAHKAELLGEAKPRAAAVSEDGSTASVDAWNASVYAGENRLKLKSKAINFGRTTFYVSNPDTKQEHATIVETISTPAMVLRTMGVGPIKFRQWMGCEIALHDPATEEPIFHVRRPLQLFALSTRVNILDSNRELIAYFKTKIFSLFGGFVVYDAEDNQIAEVKVKITMKPFKIKVQFLTPDGDEISHITDEFNDNKKTKISFAPGLIVTFGDPVRDDSRMRMIIFATTLAMEMTGAGTKLFAGPGGKAMG